VPDEISTEVISPIELLKIRFSFIIIIEFFLFDIVKDFSVLRLQHSDPSLI